MKLTLASASPRRKELLTQVLNELGLASDFEISAANIDESQLENESPVAHVERLAREKALAIALKSEDQITKTEFHEQQQPTNSDHLILGADTIVTFNGKIFGKPKDTFDAKKMLSELSGKTHEVITGFCLINTTQNEPSSSASSLTVAHDITQVTFKTLTKNEIANYVATNEPMDKAGAYAIQGGAKEFVEKITGSWSNVVGWPVEKIKTLLKLYKKR